MKLLLIVGMLVSQIALAGDERFSTSLEAKSLTYAAETVLNDFKVHYANRENILYLQYLEEHREIMPPNDFWQAALDTLSLHRLMEGFVNLGWINDSENPMR